MKASIPLAISALVLAGVVWAQAGEPVEMRWRFQKGQSAKYLFKHREIRTVEAGDQKRETITQTELEWHWTVQEVDGEGLATLEHKLTALRLTCNGKDFDFQYDSARGNQGDDTYKKKLIGLLDQVRFAGKYQLRMDSSGRLVEVKGLSKVLDENNPGDNILDFHGVNLRDDNFGWFLQQALVQFPKAGTPQKKWLIPVDTNLKDMGMVTGQLEYSLGKQVTIDKQTLQEVTLQGQQSAKVETTWFNVPLSGTLKTTRFTGSVLLQPRTGLVHASHVRIELQGDLKIGSGNMKVRYQHELELEQRP